MFPSFTGNARPKRQVNLSGRNNNPFAAYSGSKISSSPQPAANALAHAQQERLLRQQDRQRPPAATRIQKTWRGHRSRREARVRWRQEWDYREGWSQHGLHKGPYPSPEECLAQLRLLAHFVSPCQQDDIQRLHHFATRYMDSVPALASSQSAEIWTYPSVRIAKVTLAILESRGNSALPTRVLNDLLSFLEALTARCAVHLAPFSRDYYKALVNTAELSSEPHLVQSTVLALLRPQMSKSILAYEGFVSECLTQAEIPGFANQLESLAKEIDYSALASALHELLLSSSHDNILQTKSHEGLLWLLSYFIFLRRTTRRKTTDSPDTLYVKIVSKLISFLAYDIGTRTENLKLSSVATTVSRLGPIQMANGKDDASTPLPEFVRSEILTLVNQENVSSLLANLNIEPASGDRMLNSSNDASALASYALTLLQAFPGRGDEIRMWLYWGSTSSQPGQHKKGGKSMPALKYFYQAASSTTIYQCIKKDPRETVNMLRPEKRSVPSLNNTNLNAAESRDQQWRIILLFLDLYTFILKVMDDEEFLHGSLTCNEQSSWTRRSALPIGQVEDLTIFLKNLAFAMHWNASEIIGIEANEAKTSLAEYFGRNSGSRGENQDDAPPKLEEMEIAGISGMTLADVKGMVTGVLRMLYERDSRREFLPKDHWLMTKYFEMDRFIPSVVAEEEHKHQIEESYETDADMKDADEGEHEVGHETNLVGTQRTQQVRNLERLRRQQRKTSRRKYLESVTPRLEILQNMPFFIPFATRVHIFREFVALDQFRRRGTGDPDEWRFAMMHSPAGDIGKHRAKVRRENIFDDAYEQFYELGEGLKEPIQIRFVDKFDTVEEGIDGGGVTKEFLTSITNEAFGASNGLESLFVENEQHLLYPNPSAVEERKETLRQATVGENSFYWNENIRDLLRRYEFLGRIIGKCLYEGILVDIHFAPFFLLKWALTGGSGSARKESDYRANLNDLRDLDEGLYQGLVSPPSSRTPLNPVKLITSPSSNSKTTPATSKTSPSTSL